jgi:hypothetical protein
MVYLNKEFYQLASSPEMCKKNVALPFVNRNNVARSPAMWHGHEWCSKVIYLPNRAAEAYSNSNYLFQGTFWVFPNQTTFGCCLAYLDGLEDICW